MKRKQLVIAFGTIVLFVTAPAGRAVTPATVRLLIVHVVEHCHVWATPTKTLGASTKITIRPGTRVIIRSNCPMDFDFKQTKGPRLALGDPRTFAGTNRVVVFRRAGVYRLTSKNVETPEERGLVTLGAPNTLTLTVVVTP